MKYMSLLMLLFIVFTSSAQQPAKVIVSDSEVDIIPEGIAIDTKTGKVYVSSIGKHKIITIDKYGKAKDFVTSGQDSLMEALGMKIDTKRKWLWVVSNKKVGKIFKSAINAFALETGAIMQVYKMQDTVPHLLNDLLINVDGTLLITDTYFSSLYHYQPETKQLDVFLKDPSFKYPNGLVMGNNNRLYVATYGNGLMQVNLKTKEVKQLKGASDTTIAKGLDGLILYKNSIVGVYNVGDDRSKNAVVQYFLHKDGESIIKEKVLDRGHPAFHDPTTNALWGRKMYVIANSHLTEFNGNKEITTGIENKLKPVTLLVYELK